MTVMRRNRMMLGMAAVAAAILIVPTSAFAKGGPGGGGGGGGGGGEETVANSLSVPALYVGAANPSGLTCNGDYRTPTGTPLTGYPVAGYYYVQGTHSWQAGCLENQTTATVTAAWGDNLGGDAKLKVGSPIRVEMGLNAGDQGLAGFTVVKLEPALLDRVSAYGTEALLSGDPAAYAANPQPSLETRVWDVAAHLKIYPAGSPGSPIFDGPAGAEINSTGRVVYGYNLRVTATGQYVIEYTFPNVTITTANRGTVSADGHTVMFTITVGSGGGGGGGKGRNK
jgi:hypothetical protein